MQLANGLTVVVHPQAESTLAVVNVAYKVGSRDEEADKTGFAHLFEHLMFSGSVHIPSYDEPLQRAGGQNNAFTTPDYTNYYLTLPAENIETGLWLESDRMLGLAFNEKGLEVQRKVVIEEFAQRYLNQPYGDVWHKMRELAYQKHPYRWPTIGKTPEHIAQANMADVRAFFETYYTPGNAVLVIAGKITVEKGFELAEKWFGDIPAGKPVQRKIPAEPPQTSKRFLEVKAEVPVDAFYKAFPMPGRSSEGYYIADLLGDVLGRGKSSLLHRALVEQHAVFTEISAYVTGALDPGLLVISGRLHSSVSLTEAEQAVDALVYKFVDEGVATDDLERARNQALTSHAFSEVELLDKAMHLAYGFIVGDINRTNMEPHFYKNITEIDINKMAKNLLKEDKANTLFYAKTN